MINNTCIVHAKSNMFSTSLQPINVISKFQWPRTVFAKPFKRTLVTFRCMNKHNNTSGEKKPTKLVGLSSSDAIVDDQDNFLADATNELLWLAADRDVDEAGLNLSLGTDADLLYGRMVEGKEQERQKAVEDVMYKLIVHKFSVMNVSLIPPLSKCVHNDSLELILPSEDIKLGSICPSDEVREVLKNKLDNMLSKVKCDHFTDTSAPTDIAVLQLYIWYGASVTYGYLFRSSITRYQLESSLQLGDVDTDRVTFGDYVTGFARSMERMCNNLKSKEAVRVQSKRSRDLFGDVWSGECPMVNVSYESVVRIVVEGLAFGCFLKETEWWVDHMYYLDQI